ncbi:hydroxymethylbilane synthase [Seinonella peptonophila]|nr:hydroxymethylbilane synthase [Seinonella peptonophila]
MRSLTVGTRGSELAVTQTNWVINQLKEVVPHLEIKTKVIVTKGDLMQKSNIPLSKIGGKGLFLKEIERALLDGEIDFAVHSMKDVPAELPPGLKIGCIPIREDARDCLISKGNQSLDSLPSGAVIGTSSLRRQAQILAYRSDLIVESIRGNIDTRIRKMNEGSFDATVLATAGLKRLGWTEKISERISVDIMTPAIGQGALMIECREQDDELGQILSLLHHAETAKVIAAERSFQQLFQGGCHLPIAAHGQVIEGRVRLTGMVAEPDGSKTFQGVIEGDDPVQVGRELAVQLLDQGAGIVIDSVKETIQKAVQNR